MVEQQHAKKLFYGFLLSILAVTILGWWLGSFGQFSATADKYIVIGRLFGLIAAICILLQVVLMSRIPIFERNFSLEEIIDLHRLNGYGILIGIIGHLVFTVIGYNNGSLHGLWSEFVSLNVNYEDVFKATIGSVIFVGIMVLTVKFVRRHLTYELWYATHIFVYLAILLTFLHQVNSGADFVKQAWFKLFWYGLFIFVFALLAYFRFALIAINEFKFGFKVSSVTKEANNIFSIYITGNNIKDFEFEPGQFASWRFLTKDMWFEAHPFSFSSPPGGDTLRITVKASGDFSDKVANLRQGTKILIDGPRGAFTIRQAKANKIVLIAGGIGIAPYIAKIDGLLASKKQVALLYYVRSEYDIAFKNELKLLQQKGLRLQIVVTDNTGPPDSASIAKFVPSDATIFLCGPDGMVSSIKNALKKQGINKSQIISERFAF